MHRFPLIEPVRSAALITACLALWGCQTPAPGTAGATATLRPTQGQQVAGDVRFVQTGPDDIEVTATVTGLTPNQEHGFHIHEVGDCSAPDAMSAKGHFNPAAHSHGNPAGSMHHAGDMPNLKADASGRAQARFIVHGVTIGPGASSIAGRGLIVHAKPDDYASQPAGNAGARLGCGVIEVR
jgi:Cu-Zn family superoxide dismutase